jgi:NADH-quinone oxidoreductase subunit N
VGKFAVFAAVMDAYNVTGQTYLLVLLILGGMNTALSLFYYLHVVKVMTIDPEPEDSRRVELQIVSVPGVYILAVTLPILVLFIQWEALNNWTLAAASRLF